MKRIMVLGAPGAGKTVLSKIIGQRMGIDVYHLDKLLWNPKWTEKPYFEIENIHNDIIHREAWVVDGYYHKFVKKRFELADTIIVLDLPRWICLLRVIKRSMVSCRDDLASGCSNKIDFKFLNYVWNYKGRQMVDIKNYLSQHSDKEILIFKRPWQINRYIKEL